MSTERPRESYLEVVTRHRQNHEVIHHQRRHERQRVYRPTYVFRVYAFGWWLVCVKRETHPTLQHVLTLRVLRHDYSIVCISIVLPSTFGYLTVIGLLPDGIEHNRNKYVVESYIVEGE